MKVEFNISEKNFEMLMKKVKWTDELFQIHDPDKNINDRIDREMNKAIDVYLKQRRFNGMFNG